MTSVEGKKRGVFSIFVPCQPMIDEIWRGSAEIIEKFLKDHDGSNLNSSTMIREKEVFIQKQRELCQLLPDSFVYRTLGGAEINTARILAKMSSFSIDLCGMLGTDSEGDFALAQFHKEGFNCDKFQRLEDKNTAKCLVLLSEGRNDRAMISHLGAAENLPQLAFQIGKQSDSSCVYDALYLSGYIMRLKGVFGWLPCQLEAGTRLFVNLSANFCIDHNLDWLQNNWNSIEGLFCNAEEAAYLAKRLKISISDEEVECDQKSLFQHNLDYNSVSHLSSSDTLCKENVLPPKQSHLDVIFSNDEGFSIENIAKCLVQLGIGFVVITDGTGDTVAVCCNLQSIIRVPVVECNPEISVVDTTGAGDAFVAGFLAIWLREDPERAFCDDSLRLKRAICEGHRVAECVVKMHGVDPAQIPIQSNNQ